MTIGIFTRHLTKVLFASLTTITDDDTCGPFNTFVVPKYRRSITVYSYRPALHRRTEHYAGLWL